MSKLCKLFFSCPHWKKNTCGFFKWVNESQSQNSSSSVRNLNEAAAEKAIVDGSTLSRLEDKIERLKEKKQVLISDNEELKNQLVMLKIERDVSMERERTVCRLLYLSWMVFTIVIILIVGNKFV